MGQAKLRGTREQRIEAAEKKANDMRPESLTCGECHTVFSDFETMDTRGMAGIDGIYLGYCPSCGCSVFSVEGDEDARLRVADEWKKIRATDAEM